MGKSWKNEKSERKRGNNGPMRSQKRGGVGQKAGERKKKKGTKRWKKEKRGKEEKQRNGQR